jgi:regulator of replication initiation timing
MRNIVSTCLLIAFASVAVSARTHDPLKPAEVAQMRDTAQEPQKRLPLMVNFAKARMIAIDQLRGDPKFAEGRGQQIHDLLDEFRAIVDEIDDNMDMYSRQKSDLRKALKTLIEADTEWQLKLRGLKEATDPKSQQEKKEYDFVLDSAIDSVNSNVDGARELLEAQNKSVEESKRKK